MIAAILISLAQLWHQQVPVGLPPKPARAPLPAWSALWHPRRKGERANRHNTPNRYDR